jgi:hypothetical protein
MLIFLTILIENIVHILRICTFLKESVTIIFLYIYIRDLPHEGHTKAEKNIGSVSSDKLLFVVNCAIIGLNDIRSVYCREY